MIAVLGVVGVVEALLVGVVELLYAVAPVVIPTIMRQADNNTF